VPEPFETIAIRHPDARAASSAASTRPSGRKHERYCRSSARSAHRRTRQVPGVPERQRTSRCAIDDPRRPTRPTSSRTIRPAHVPRRSPTPTSRTRPLDPPTCCRDRTTAGARVNAPTRTCR
jgi:hypothetical protein